MKSFRTFIEARATKVDRDGDQFKSIAARYGLELKPQMDIIYIESCLVSAGNMAGINDNDDIFTREEAWAARHTPVMKPLNWQHNDKDIVGVMYSIQARDLNGNIIDFDSETPPDFDFDLYTEAVVWKLVRSDRATEIEERSKGGTLFVSMEAWFDDYHYGICNTSGALNDIVGRDKSTAFLDGYLKVNRGTGSYDGKRIGRVLRGVTFGGCGLVDRPANKRSVITNVKTEREFISVEDSEKFIELILSKLNSKEEVLMNAQANQNDRPLTKAEIAELLDEREKLQAQAAEQTALKARADAAEDKAGKLEQEVSSLTQTLETKQAENDTLNQEIRSLQEALDQVVQAGATSSTPPEIAAVDKARTVDELVAAKLAWIRQSMARLQERARRADELEAELVIAGQVVREQHVRNLFNDILPEDHIDALVAKARNLSDEDFEDWLAEKELLVLDMSAQGAELRPKREMLKDREKEKSKSEEAFRSLVEKRLGEAGLINHPGGANMTSGLTSNGLKSVLLRHKVAGTAGDDLANELDAAQPDADNVDLAGATQAGDEEGSDKVIAAFNELANLVTGKKIKED